MTKKIISRAFALLTVTLFATVALAGTASATIGDATIGGDVAFRGLGTCRGEYEDSSKTCTGVYQGPRGYTCIGKYYGKTEVCDGVEDPSSQSSA